MLATYDVNRSESYSKRRTSWSNLDSIRTN